MITQNDIYYDGRVILSEAYFNKNFTKAEEAVDKLTDDFRLFAVEALFATDMRHDIVHWTRLEMFTLPWKGHQVDDLLRWFNLMKYHTGDMDAVVYDVLEWYSALMTPAFYEENETWEVVDFIKDILSDYHTGIPAWLDRDNDTLCPEIFMSYAPLMVEKILYPVFHLAEASGESLLACIIKCDAYFNPCE